MSESQEETPGFDSKLLPILREALDVVKMILFKELKDYFVAEHPQRTAEAGRLAAAALNDMFGVQNPDPEYASFVEASRGLVDAAITTFPSRCQRLLIPLTDALRMQFLCDSREGVDESSDFLARAKERGLLLEERDLPMPHSFLDLVRRLGAAYGLVAPPTPPQ